MRRFATLLFLLLAAALPARAQGLPDADRAAIRATITQQIEAFGRDDGPAAFGFASPTLQGLFGTPENFMGMVRQGYAPVYRPRAFAFGNLSPRDGLWVQAVHLTGPDGGQVMALYSMEREPDGTWRIAGCTLTEDPGRSA